MNIAKFQTMTIQEKSLWFVKQLVNYNWKVGDK